MIRRYFAQIRKVLDRFAHIITTRSISEKTYDDEFGFIKGQLNFIDDSRLEFAEVKHAQEATKRKYRYQYMDKQKNLIFRYDNAKHYPDLPNFPNHKHLPNEVLSCEEPSLELVMQEIEKKVAKNDSP